MGEHRVVSASTISEALGISPGQLAKVLQCLVNAKKLVSRRGRGGGFTASRDTRTATLLEVIELVDATLERFAGDGGLLMVLQQAVLRQVRHHLGATRVAELVQQP